MMRTQKKQNGAALITALFFLIILTMLALTSMNMNIMDEKMASNSQQKNRLFQSAESALVVAINDENSTSSGNTCKAPYNQAVANLDADMTVNFTSTHIAVQGFGRQEEGSDQEFAKHYFELDVNAENMAAIEKNIRAAIWILGPNDPSSLVKCSNDSIGGSS